MNNDVTYGCKKCGHEISVDDKVCPSCGSVVNSDNKKGKVAILVILLFLFFVLIGTVVLSYFVVFKSPNTVFDNAVNTLYKNISGYLSEIDNDDYNKLDASFKNDFSINGSNDDISLFDTEFSYLYDKNNEISFYSIKNDMLDFSYYITDGNVYYKVNDFDKYIVSKSSYSGGSDIGLYNTILNQLKSNVIDSLKPGFFKSFDTEINVDGKTVSATANELVLNQQNMASYVKNLTTKLKNDNKFINAICKLYGFNKDDVVKFINDYKNNYTYSGKDFIITIYTYGFKNEISSISIKQIDSENTSILNIDNSMNFKYIENNDTKFTGSFEYEDGLHLNVSGNDFKYQMNCSYKSSNEDVTIILPDFSSNIPLNSLTSDEIKSMFIYDKAIYEFKN